MAQITKALIAELNKQAYAAYDASAAKHPTAPAFHRGAALDEATGLLLVVKTVGTKRSMRGAIRDTWKLNGKVIKTEALKALAV